MSSIDQVSQALPDFFCELYDSIDMAEFRRHAASWIDDDGISSTVLAIERQLEAGIVGVGNLRIRLENHGDRERMRFTILSALDRVFAVCNPVAPTGRGVPPALTKLALHAASQHRFDSGAQGGALIPRVVSRFEHATDHPREAFASVLRVEACNWDACEFRVLTEDALLMRHEIEHGLRVGCVPFVEDPDEMRIEPYVAGKRRHYRIEPRDLPVTTDRIETVLDGLVTAQVRIGLVPELMLTTALLSAWKAALKRRRGALGRLQWLLVGSGNLNTGGVPVNAAVLLNARTGEELVRQHKIYPFDFDSARLKLWKLTDRLGSEHLSEHLDPGERLVVMDGGGLRLAILVCEDLARVTDLSEHIRAFGVSHLLVPVFARPTKDYRWERARADVHCEATGSTVIVANSRVMHSITGIDEGTGLVVWPAGGVVLRAATPEAIASTVVLADGSAKLA